jgi:molecular chaperone HtpG
MAEIRMGLRLLETLTSALYEDPIILFREYVQNSADAYNDAIKNNILFVLDDFGIDINIDPNLSSIIITDNGYGIPESEFIVKMRKIGSSDKSQSLDQIGFRGIGRLSGMPFCEKLIFINKPIGLKKCLIYTWDGEAFYDLLNEEPDHELGDAVDRISRPSEENYEGPIGDHFFRVELHGYKYEIKELIDSQDFKQRLSMLLPLKYSPDFSYKEIIKNKYEQEMGESLDKFSFMVSMNGEYLYKPYENKHILESDIIFWELKDKTDGIENKFGILWFTFNRKMSTNPISEPYGILVRSKNMLMGDRESLENAIARNKNDYVATYRELAQTLRGVYGEMLLKSPRLHDNARRDWFRIDNASIELRNIIADFLKLLVSYRYSASKAFNNQENTKVREKLIKAYSDLTTGYNPEKFINDFYQNKDMPMQELKGDEKVFEYADEDIPYMPITLRRFYERIAKCLREYFVNNNNLQEFLKIRAYFKKHLNEESKE